jgi:hypothetical protein
MAAGTPVKASKAFGAGDFFGVNNVTTPTPTSFDTPQDMSLSVKRELKSITGVNLFPDDVNAGAASITGKVTMGSLNGRIWGDLVAGVGASKTGLTVNVAKREKGVVANNNKITVKNHGTGVFLRDLGVRGAENLPFIRVANPGAITLSGHYSVTTGGEYQFHPSREGDTVDITYEWQGLVNNLGAVYNITNQPQGAVGDFTAVMATRWRSEENVFTLNSCIVSDYEIATKGGDYAKPTLSYQAQADAYDNIGVFSYAQHR